MQVQERPSSPDTDARKPIRATIVLRQDTFDAMTSLLRASTDEARARLIGVNARTIARARQGVIGEEFIGRAIANLRQHRDRLAPYNLVPTFDALFEVVEVKAS